MSFTHKFSGFINNNYLKFSSFFDKKIPDSVLYDVPYKSQFASAEYCELVLKNKVAVTTDPKWPETGASNPHEYETWVTTICGMACTTMALDFFNKKLYPTITLAKEAKAHGVYQSHHNEISGLRYKEYCSWILDYNLKANMYSKLSVTGIIHLLSKGNLVIVSVNPNIRGINTVSIKQIGGHLVLAVGYDKNDDTITIHNPSGFLSNNSHSFHKIKSRGFKKYFAGRGISLSKKF